MADTAENAASRLWRDRMQAREQERNEAQAQARMAEKRAATLAAENGQLATQNAHLIARAERLEAQNDRLAVEVAHLSAQNERLVADLAWLRDQFTPAPARAETQQDLKAVKAELLSLLDQLSGSRVH